MSELCYLWGKSCLTEAQVFLKGPVPGFAQDLG
jgi:hypothetical protein